MQFRAIEGPSDRFEIGRHRDALRRECAAACAHWPHRRPHQALDIRVPAALYTRLTQVGERIWLVTFMQYDLGYFDDEMCRLEPIDNPFARKCYLCHRAPASG